MPTPSQPSKLLPIPLGSDVLSKLGQEPSKQAIVYSISSIESSYGFHVAKGPGGFTHEDRPALIVVCAVLNAMEGFLWKYIRGAVSATSMPEHCS